MLKRIAICAIVLAVAPYMAAADTIPQDVVENAFEKVSPALCLLSFTAETTNPQTGQVAKRDGQALGVLVSPDGLLMTHGRLQTENAQASDIRVKVGRDRDEKEYDVVLLKKPDDVNVCLMRIQHDKPLKLPYVRFTRGSSLALGEPVAVFGLLGKSMDFSPSMLTRIVGAILPKPRTTYCLDESAMPFGFLGGPVINAKGQVVGVVGFDLSEAEGGELYVRSGHPLVYQTDLFAKYIDNPPTETELVDARNEAWLGVFTQPLKDALAEYWGLEPKGGVVVSTVMPGSPAAETGLQRGDVIIEFNGTPVRAKRDEEMLGFSKLVRESEAGTVVHVIFLRDGVTQELDIPLIARPRTAREAEEFEDDVFGLTVRELTTDQRIRMNLPEDVQGVVVRRVRSGSWAQLAGMRPGVIVMNFGGHPTTNVEEFQQAAMNVAEKKPAEVTVFCRVGAQTGFFRLEPAWEDDAEKK